MRQSHVVGQTIVIFPSKNTNVVIPLSCTGKHLGVQPPVNQPSWGYTYPGNQPPTRNVNYQPISSGIVYPGMPYPRNMFTTWAKLNWSYIPIPG